MQNYIYYIVNKFLMNSIEKEIVKYLDKKEKIVFDVGCYRGIFTKKLIKYGRQLGKKFNFFLFDPNPNVKNYLSTLLNSKNIKYFDLALDNSNTKKNFYLNNFFEPSGSSLNTIIKNDKKWYMTRRIVMQVLQPFKKIGHFSEIEVKTQTLDNFCYNEKINFIDVLKIDSEGNELNILKGAEKLLLKNKIYLIYTEISESKKEFDKKENILLDFLNGHNFELKNKHQIKSVSFLSDIKATDNIFVNKNFSV